MNVQLQGRFLWKKIAIWRSLKLIFETENVYIALLFILYYISFYDTAIIIVFTKFIVVSTQGFPRPLPPLLLHPIL